MKLYNTLSRKVETLTPIQGSKVKLYTCGLTVYGQPHIGNWLGYIYWDVMVRALKANGYEVEHTQNITDVGHLVSDDDNGEDKMEKGARLEGKTAWDVARTYIAVAENESNMLGLTPPTHIVRATDMIPQQIEFTKLLENKGFMYEIASDGMYFDTSKLADYGKLARLDIDGLEAGARVSVEGKKNITDFAVWKYSPKDVKRDMEWDSPWGKGFPGWHLECSVIARETLGDQIDIHTGGIDHIPVHHTNEIAQTEAATGKRFSQFWVHNNHIKADGRKISKSLGNIYTLQDILDKGFSVDAFRVFALGKHYRTEGNFSWDNLEAAYNRLNHWKAVATLRWQADDSFKAIVPASEAAAGDLIGKFKKSLLEALSNDIDSVSALNEIDRAVNAIESQPLEKLIPSAITALFDVIDDLLGLKICESTPDLNNEQKQLLKDRQIARDNKDWAASDNIRDSLLEQSIGLNDTSKDTTWRWL